MQERRGQQCEAELRENFTCFSKLLYGCYCCCFFFKVCFKLEINTKLPVASSCDPDPSLSVTTSFLRNGPSLQGHRAASRLPHLLGYNLRKETDGQVRSKQETRAPGETGRRQWPSLREPRDRTGALGWLLAAVLRSTESRQASGH